MSRGRRSGNEAAMSLFSFQDVMMGVMGVLILITLLMALQLTEQIENVVQAETSPQPTVNESELRQLRQTVERLRREVATQQELLERLAARQDLAPEVARMKARLEQTLEELREIEKQVAEAEFKAQKEHTAAAQAQQQEIEKLQQRVASLSNTLKEQRLNPRLTYLVQPGSTRSPILVELANQAIGIAVPSNPDNAIWLSGGTVEDRLRSLRSFAASRNRQADYFVLLLKPSAFDMYHRARQMLVDGGFQVGTELIEESAQVLVRPEG